MTEPIEITTTAQTQQLIDNIADYLVEQTYGHDVTEPVKGARLIALGALKFDLAGQVDPQHEDAIARGELRAREREALEARRCQCPQLGGCSHAVYPSLAGRAKSACEYYYESDVPAIDGKLLCGMCYAAVADERGLPVEQ